MVHSTAHRHSMWRSETLWVQSAFFVNRRWSPLITSRCKYALTMHRWISQNNIRLPCGAFFISVLFFFNAVCIVSDNLLIIESFGEMAYNISYLTRVPGTNTLLACCCLLRPEEVNSEYWRVKKQAETEIADFIAQKIAELNKNTGKEVSEIRFTAREKMTGLESYDVKIKIMWFCEHHPVRGDVPLVANLVTNHWRLRN